MPIEELLTSVKHDGEFVEAGSPVPVNWPEDVVADMREQGAIGIPELTSAELGDRMDELDALLQAKTGHSLADLYAELQSEDAAAEAPVDEDEEPNGDEEPV